MKNIDMDIKTSQKEQIRNFISEITFTAPEKIKDETLLFEEGLFDSLGFLSLVNFINDEFGIEVENDELNEENFESINALTSFISQKKEK